MKRGKGVIVGLVVVALVLGVAWFVLGRRGGGGGVQADAPPWTPGTTSSAAVSSSQPPPLTVERAQQLQAGLASADEPTTRGVVAMATGATIDPAVVTALAQYPVTFDTTTFATDNDGTASVKATVASDPPTTYTVFLVDADGQWLISATVPA